MINKVFYKYTFGLFLLITIAYSCNSNSINGTNQNEEMMIEYLQNIATYLIQDSITVEDLVPKIGTLENDLGFLLPMEIKSKEKGIRSIQLSRYPNSDIPYLVSFELYPDTKLTLAQLAKQFGAYKELPVDRGMPIEYIFSTPIKGASWSVYVLVILEQAAEDENTNSIFSVTLRRDDMS